MRKKIEDLEVIEEREALFSEMTENGTFDLVDNRRISEGNIRHSLQEILLVWLCAMMCELTSYRDIEWYAKLKLSFFRKFFPYKFGPPSKSTIIRVIATIEPSHMNSLLLATISNAQSKNPLSDDEIRTIALDGKTSCGAQITEENKNRLHIVSAFDTESGITLAQESVPDKTNEITAIKSLLSTLCIEGRTITIDAIGTQKEHTKIIRDREAHYILAVKENQKTLYNDIKAFFACKENQEKFQYYEEYDKGHGRIERRACFTTDKVEWFKEEGWIDLKSIVMVKAERTINNKTTSCIRYFITSHEPFAKQLLRAIRSHWSIESMHWTLDVTFNEDGRIMWNRTIAYNEAIARRIAMNMLKNFRETFKTPVKTEKATYKLLRKVMFADDDALESVLRKTFK